MQAFPIDSIRRRFPAISGNPARVYMDNPAGTQIPATVADAVARAMTKASSNLGGYFPDSVAADATWLAGHEAGAELLGASSYREIIVGQSMTALTFHMSRCLGPRFLEGDEIIVTRMDHGRKRVALAGSGQGPQPERSAGCRSTARRSGSNPRTLPHC